jgi:hypothetical protein
MYTIGGRKLYSLDIATGNQIRIKDIGADTLIAYKIYKKAVYLYGIIGDSAVNECKTEVKHFRLVNVSYDHQFVYVALMFHTNGSGKARDRYAIVQLDTTLNFRNYYIIKPMSNNEWSNFPPFQASEFSREGNMLIPKIEIGDSAKFTYGGYEFRKDRNELIFFYHSGGYFVLPLTISVFADSRTLLSPAIFPVPNSGSEYFYAFPFPYLYNSRTHQNFDPYHLKKKLDSLERKASGEYLNGHNMRLVFEWVQARDKNVVLASQQIKGYIYLVVSNADILKTDIVRCDLVISETRLVTLDIPLHNHYFVFGNNKLYSLSDETTTVIQAIDLEKLKF